MVLGIDHLNTGVLIMTPELAEIEGVTRVGLCSLDCYWVGFLDFNLFRESFKGFSVLTPPKVKLAFSRGVLAWASFLVGLLKK